MPIVAEEGPTKPSRPVKELFEPEAYVVKDSSGKDHVCFDPKGGQKVGGIFSDYHVLWAYVLSLESEISLLERELELSNDTADRWEAIVFEMQERGDLYKKSFESEHKLLLESEKERYKRNRWTWVPWSVTAVVSIVFGVVYVVK